MPPLTLNQIDAEAEYYGVKFSPLGEDGDLGWAAFTDDRRRALAALHRHIRVDLGAMKKSITISTLGKLEWWRVFDNCGCGTECRCPVDEHGDTEHECDHAGLPPCIEDGDGGFIWLGERCEPDATGALPVICMDADYDIGHSEEELSKSPAEQDSLTWSEVARSKQSEYPGPTTWVVQFTSDAPEGCGDLEVYGTTDDLEEQIRRRVAEAAGLPVADLDIAGWGITGMVTHKGNKQIVASFAYYDKEETVK